MYVKDVLHLPEAARRLKISYPVVYRLVLTGQLDAERVGSRWQVSRMAVERFRKSRMGRGERDRQPAA